MDFRLLTGCKQELFKERVLADKLQTSIKLKWSKFVVKNREFKPT